MTVGLAAVRAWDLAELRGCVGTLELIAERTGSWRLRLDAVTHELSRAECWSGPAATAAAAALVELSTVAASVQQSLTPSADHLDRAVTAASDAQGFAVSAQAVADSGPVALADDGTVAAVPAPTAAMADDQLAALDAMVAAADRAEALAAAAQQQALEVATQARMAGDALAPLGPLATAGPIGFLDLAGALLPPGPVLAPPPPEDGSPADVAAWWSSLTAAEQYAALRGPSDSLGRLDGLPAWARDLVNRRALAVELAHPMGTGDRHATAQAVAMELQARERAGQPVQLQQLDLDEGQVGIALGNLDTASDIAVLVPGINTTVVDDLDALGDSATRLAAATADAAPGAAVAVLVWLGYTTPGLLTAPLSFRAELGGRSLDHALDGLAAARTVPAAGTGAGAAAVRTTVVAHSYGTVVVNHAADDDGELAADAVVLLGSPGIAEWTAAGLEVPEVYDASSPGDPVAQLGWFGTRPEDDWWGSTHLPVDVDEGHSEYLDADRPTLRAIGEVVAGER